MFQSRPEGDEGSGAARQAAENLRALVDARSVAMYGVERACADVDTIAGKERAGQPLAVSAKNILRFGGLLAEERVRHDLYGVLLPLLIDELSGTAKGLGGYGSPASFLAGDTYEEMMKVAKEQQEPRRLAAEATARLAAVGDWGPASVFEYTYPGRVAAAKRDLELLAFSDISPPFLAPTLERMALIIDHASAATGDLRPKVFRYFGELARLTGQGSTRELLNYLGKNNNTWVAFREKVPPVHGSRV
jgi:hypothetical protein